MKKKRRREKDEEGMAYKVRKKREVNMDKLQDSSTLVRNCTITNLQDYYYYYINIVINNIIK